MQEYLLGIDAGTSGVKAIVMDTAGVICGSGYQECDVITPAQLGRAASRRLVGRL